MGLRAAMPPRAEKSAPTQWGAKIMDEIVRDPHAWDLITVIESIHNPYTSLEWGQNQILYHK